jgi:hypothetical protein
MILKDILFFLVLLVIFGTVFWLYSLTQKRRLKREREHATKED